LTAGLHGCILFLNQKDIKSFFAGVSMSNEERLMIARHIAAKVADEEFRKTLQEAQDLQKIGMVQAVGRIIIAQLGIELNDDAEGLVGLGFACGHALGRDLAKAEAMESVGSR
jgi:hypothetical protein